MDHPRYGPAWLLAAAVSSALPAPVMAWPVVCVNCATNIQAMQASLAQAKDYVESVQQTYNTIQSLRHQTTNLQRLGNMDWGNTEQQLRNLSNIASQGQAISYSTANLNTRWNRHFQGMDGYEQQSIDDINAIDNYRVRGDTLRDTAKSALAVANTMTEYQQEDNATLQRAQSHSAGAKGALQAAQANGELLAQVSRQLQKIQTLLQADIQMSSTYIASEVDRLDAQKVATNKLHRDAPNVNVTDGIDWSTKWGSSNESW